MEELYQQAESFQNKTDQLRNMEIRRNVAELDALATSLESCRKEVCRQHQSHFCSLLLCIKNCCCTSFSSYSRLIVILFSPFYQTPFGVFFCEPKQADSINEEQRLLEWTVTPFPQIEQTAIFLEPYDRMWRMAQQFFNSMEEWLNGPLAELSAEAIEEELGQHFRNAYKLTKTMSGHKGPLKTSEQLKGKIDEFRKHGPILRVLCNPGMQDRHWRQVSELSGFDITPDKNTTLQQMLAINLSKHLEALEDISAQASKEYSLEKVCLFGGRAGLFPLES